MTQTNPINRHTRSIRLYYREYDECISLVDNEYNKYYLIDHRNSRYVQISHGYCNWLICATVEISKRELCHHYSRLTINTQSNRTLWNHYVMSSKTFPEYVLINTILGTLIPLRFLCIIIVQYLFVWITRCSNSHDINKYILNYLTIIRPGNLINLFRLKAILKNVILERNPQLVYN